MSFLHPEFLYYLLPPIFVLFGFLLTQKESQAHFFSDEVIEKLRVSTNMMTLKARNALFFIVGILMVLALAQPVIKEGTVKIKAKSADIMIALDISDSMLAEDVYPSRLELAKKKALSLLADAPNERLGVIAFAKNSYLVSPLSFDSAAVSFLLSKLDTASITQKGTDYLSMLEVAANSQTKTEKKYLLILTDGADKGDFSEEIAYAKEKNIVVFILGMGSKKGAPIKQKDGSFIKYKGEIIISKLNEQISSLATKTGGVYIQNTISDKDIKTMYKEMQSVSDKKELKSQEIQKYIPLFYYPLGLALFILLVAMSSMSKRVKVEVPNLFMLFIIGFASMEAKAGMLDFMELQKAKKAYEAGDYNNSAKIYEDYASTYQNGQSYYNAANSYYKQGNYKKALELYQKAVFDSDFQRADNFANIGNAYVKSKTPESLNKAVEAYENSLKIKEDKDVRENLEAVKKELEKQKKQQQQNQDNKENKENKENKDEQQKNDSKSDKQEDKKEKNEKKNKQDKQDNKNQENNDSKSDENKESKDEKENKIEQQEAQIKQMSDAELQKWIDKLQNKQRTYLYKLDKKNKREDEYEKPW